MSSGGNQFALLSDEGFTPVSKDNKAAKKTQAPAAPKQQAKKPAADKKPILKDRHTKGGRSKGDVEGKGKRPFDRSISRTGRGREERKGQDRSVPGGWAQLDPEADQVPAYKPEEDKPVVVEQPKDNEPQPFLMGDYARKSQKAPGDKSKPIVAVLASGKKNAKKGGQVKANKKEFSIDEFTAINGGAGNDQRQFQSRRRPNPRSASDFPTL